MPSGLPPAPPAYHMPLGTLAERAAPGLRPGLALLAAGRYEAAEAKIAPYLKTHREDGTAYLAEAATWIAREQYGAALPTLLEGLRRVPGFEPGWRELGLCYYYQKRYDRAVAASEHAISMAPADGEAWLIEGLAHAMAGHDSQALTAIRHATTLLPDSFTAWQMEGRLWLEERQPAKAEPALERALQLKPADGPTINYLRQALDRQGKHLQALALWWRSFTAPKAKGT